MAEEESRGGYEEAQAMASRTSERMGIAQGSRPLRRQVPIGNGATAVMAMGEALQNLPHTPVCCNR